MAEKTKAICPIINWSDLGYSENGEGFQPPKSDPDVPDVPECHKINFPNSLRPVLIGLQDIIQHGKRT